MNKLMLPTMGCALALLATATNVHARGVSMGHISTGPVATGGSASQGAATAPGMGKGASDIKTSHVHGYDMGSTTSVPAAGGLQRNANGTLSHSGPSSASTEVNSGLLSQIQARGIVLGVGNSLGSADSLSGKGLGGGNDKGKINGIVRHLSRTGSANGKHDKMGASMGSGKPMATTLGSTRSSKTGEVCIWGAGADGSCH